MMLRLPKNLWLALLLIPLLVTIPGVTLASELLQPFTANYKLYKGGISVARITVSLQQQDNHWLWRSDMKPASWFSLFSDSQSFNKTRFVFENAAPTISQINLGEKQNEQLVETAIFDWSANKLFIQRKGKNRELTITKPVYDYQSIHLLAAELQRSEQKTKRVRFYRNGKLTTATMQYEGSRLLEYGNKPQQTEVFTLRRENSETVLTYFYAPGQPLYPIRVEQEEPDSSGFVILLQADKA